MAKPPMVNMGPTDDEARRRRRRDCLVVSLAVGVIGVTFGVFAEAAGFDLPRIVVMSALVFTGASQFAAVGVNRRWRDGWRGCRVGVVVGDPQRAVRAGCAQEPARLDAAQTGGSPFRDR